MEMALSLSNGFANVDVMGKELISFSEKAVCLKCGISYPPFTPASFSFNSPSGACPSCSGLGSITGFDSHLLIPNPELSLREGAVVIWAKRHSVQFMDFLESLTQSYGSDIYTPYRELSDEFRQVLLYGSGDKKIPIHIEKNKERITFLRTFEGIIPKLERQYRETESTASRDDLKRFMNFHSCPVCKGDRLNPAARSVHIGEKTISEINALSIAAARRFFNDLKLEGKQQIIAGRVLKEIVERLSFLENVGLSYLTLDRSAITLSGGEGQRIRLATQIGSRLTGVLYVLDEPSIGLHQRDNRLLLNTLLTMRDMGNTVLVVEHDEETICSADHVVDMGPGAGQNGGEVMFSGPPSMLSHASNSLTAQYMFGQKRIETPRARRPFGPATILVEGANGNNLKDISVEFPLVFIIKIGTAMIFPADIDHGLCAQIGCLNPVLTRIHLHQEDGAFNGFAIQFGQGSMANIYQGCGKVIGPDTLRTNGIAIQGVNWSGQAGFRDMNGGVIMLHHRQGESVNANIRMACSFKLLADIFSRRCTAGCPRAAVFK